MTPLEIAPKRPNGLLNGALSLILATDSPLRRAVRSGVVLIAVVGTAGCQTLSLGQSGGNDVAGLTPPRAVATGAPAAPAPEKEPELTWAESTAKTTNKVVNFVTGREQENKDRAKTLYGEADALFRQAAAQPRDGATKTYKSAAKLFHKAGEASPGSALEQDALFMEGESLFFADRLTDATEVYQRLQKDFPRSRHNDRVAARLFSISRYWIETVEARKDKWFNVNLTDPKRPRLDVDGHAIRVLDQIRYDDPTGRLADDATMAAAAEFIRQKKFDRADEFLTDLRDSFSDSDHLFLAHLMGIRCKLEVYAGPRYSGLVLEEADKLVKQTRQRFPDRLQERKYADMVARSASEISFLRAERLAYRADYREKRKEYGAARYYYNELLKLHGDTPQADLARERLAAIEKYPSIPTQRLSWLTTIFPDSKSSDPLILNGTDDGEEAADKTMLR